MANELGWDQENIDYMRVAGPMHDVGKIGIPDEILRKPGKLSSEEFAIIQQHPLIGARILGDSSIPLLKMAHDIALYHHEKWNGSGYPFGLKGDAIPQSAQIIALVDVYDALRNDRVYRKALPEDQVLPIMAEGKGRHFNPQLFDVFIKMLPAFREIRKKHADVKIHSVNYQQIGTSDGKNINS